MYIICIPDNKNILPTKKKKPDFFCRVLPYRIFLHFYEFNQHIHTIYCECVYIEYMLELDYIDIQLKNPLVLYLYTIDRSIYIPYALAAAAAFLNTIQLPSKNILAEKTV